MYRRARRLVTMRGIPPEQSRSSEDDINCLSFYCLYSFSSAGFLSGGPFQHLNSSPACALLDCSYISICCESDVRCFRLNIEMFVCTKRTRETHAAKKDKRFICEPLNSKVITEKDCNNSEKRIEV